MAAKPGELSDCNADRVLPGEGILDLPALIAVLERHGYAGFFSIEMFNADLWAMPAAEAAERCYGVCCRSAIEQKETQRAGLFIAFRCPACLGVLQ